MTSDVSWKWKGDHHKFLRVRHFSEKLSVSLSWVLGELWELGSGLDVIVGLDYKVNWGGFPLRSPRSSFEVDRVGLGTKDVNLLGARSSASWGSPLFLLRAQREAARRSGFAT